MAQLTNEEIVNGLLSIYNKHFHGYRKDFEYTVLTAAAERLGKPRSLRDLLDDLETQRHIIKAAGWPGVAELMLDAARRLSEVCQSEHLQGCSLPLSDEDLAKEIKRHVQHLRLEKGDGSAADVFLDAAQRLSTRTKPSDG